MVKMLSKTKVMLLAGMLVPIVFLGILTVLGYIQPGYSAISDIGSHLENGQNGWIMDLNFIVTGVLIVLFSFGFYKSLTNLIGHRTLKLARVLLVVSGIGVLVGGIFIADPTNQPTTFHGMIHVGSFFFVILPLITVAILIGLQLKKKSKWKALGNYSIVAGIGMLVLLAVFGYTVESNSEIIGFAQRVLLLWAFAWYFVFGLKFLNQDV